MSNVRSTSFADEVTEISQRCAGDPKQRAERKGSVREDCQGDQRRSNSWWWSYGFGCGSAVAHISNSGQVFYFLFIFFFWINSSLSLSLSVYSALVALTIRVLRFCCGYFFFLIYSNREQLAFAERAQMLCRDESIEGVRFYVNFFKNY